MITRRAIFIGCPGQRGVDFLPGVQQDLLNFPELLCSERGGKFVPDEIVTLLNPTPEQLTTVIRSSAADYTLVYFSGHGYTDAYGTRRLCFDGYSIPDTFLLDRSPRQLIIIDACRNYVSGAAIGAIGSLSDPYDYATGSPVRDLFDRWIADSPAGKMIVHATSPGKYAGDTKTGGVFTKALLRIMTNYETNDGYAPVCPQVVLQHVCGALDTQTPEVVYSEGQLTVPLAVGKPREVLSDNVLSARPVKTQAAPGSGGVGLVLLGLLLVGCIATR